VNRLLIVVRTAFVSIAQNKQWQYSNGFVTLLCVRHWVSTQGKYTPTKGRST
jgi:hypothetical protein